MLRNSLWCFEISIIHTLCCTSLPSLFKAFILHWPKRNLGTSLSACDINWTFPMLARHRSIPPNHAYWEREKLFFFRTGCSCTTFQGIIFEFMELHWGGRFAKAEKSYLANYLPRVELPELLLPECKPSLGYYLRAKIVDPEWYSQTLHLCVQTIKCLCRAHILEFLKICSGWREAGES